MTMACLPRFRMLEEGQTAEAWLGRLISFYCDGKCYIFGYVGFPLLFKWHKWGMQLTTPQKLRTGLVFSMWVRLVVGARDLWSRILPLLTLPFRISRALYARAASCISEILQFSRIPDDPKITANSSFSRTLVEAIWLELKSENCHWWWSQEYVIMSLTRWLKAVF